METNEIIYIAVNAAICVAGMFMCVRRLNFMDKSTKHPIRVHYVMWFAIFIWSAIAWTTGDLPGISQIFLSGMGLLQLILGSTAWHRGAPDYTKKYRSGMERRLQAGD